VFGGPRGIIENLAEPGVTVLFNRTMRSLDDEQARTPPVAVRTEAGIAIAGTWRWIGTRGLLFTPDSALAASTRYRVTVPRNTHSIEGEELAGDYSFVFSTPRPRVVASDPSEGTASMRPKDGIRVDFNQLLDDRELARVAHLFVRTSDGETAHAVPCTVANLPPPSALRDIGDTTPKVYPVLVAPTAPLPLDAAVELVIDKGLRGEGPLTMDRPAHIHVRTYGPLRLATVTCPRVFDSQLGQCQAHRDITVALSSEVMPDEFRSHLAMGRLPKAPVVKKTELKAPPPLPQTEFALGADPGFGMRYRITLTAGMTDIYGQRLGKNISFDVDTEPPFSEPAKQAVAKPAPKDDDDSPNTDDVPKEAPAAHDRGRAIPPFEAEFGIDSSYHYVLEALSKPHVIPVGLVNVPTYGLISRALDAREARQWLFNEATSPGGFLSGGYRFRWETPNPPTNSRLVRSIDLDALLAPRGFGAALLAIGTPSETGPQRAQVVSVTDLGVSAKMSKFGSLVWVTSLATGKPVAGAQVTIAHAASSETHAFVTDDRGIALVPPDAFEAVSDKTHSLDSASTFVVRHGDDWTYAQVEESPTFRRAAPFDVDLMASKEWQAAVYSDRGVYRPGETVKIGAVIRQADASGLTIAKARDVRVSLTDSHGDQVFDGRGTLDELGGLAVDLPLPKTVHLGTAMAKVTMISSPREFGTSLLIADFKPAEFTVTARADKTELVRGDVAHFSVHGEYLFHAPMAKAAAHNTAVRSVVSFAPKNSEAFVTSDEVYTNDYGDKSPRAGELLEQDAVLDSGGNCAESIGLAMPGQTKPEMISFESEVEDFTRQVIAGSASTIVHPAEFYVGVRRPESNFAAVGATLSPEVLAFRPDGSRVSGVAVKLELVERTWVTVVEDSGEGSRKSIVKDTTVVACDLATALTPRSCAIRLPETGYFVVRATATDRRGNTVRSSTGLYAVSDQPDEGARESRTIGWAERDARIIKLEPDKAKYGVGDTAKVLIRNPFQEAEALVTVERAGVLASQTTIVRGPMPVVSIPIRDEYFPNVYVSVHLVRGRVQSPPQSGADIGRPDYREGYVEIKVNPESHRLHVGVTSDKKEYRPGDDIDADVIVKDAYGSPTRADVTFYAVDEGVLMLTDYRTPDPLDAFTRPRSLAVVDLESRDHLARIRALRAGEKLKNAGWEEQPMPCAESSDKGNPGGGGDSPGGGKARRDFRNTAYFEAGRVTSADGKARFHFKLPDNLTTYRLMAVAASTDRFGSGQANVTASKRLMLRPALPRAIRVGDRFDASVVLSGKDLGDLAADVSIALGSPSLSLEGPALRHVTLPASGNVEVHFPLMARSPGEPVVEFSGSAGGERDAVRVTKSVTTPLHLETTAVYGETERATAIAIGDLSKIRSDKGGLDLRLSSSALVGLEEVFAELEQYPYGCTEQLASRMIPLVALDDLARSVGARVPASTESRMTDAVFEMLAHQRDSGGFGFWDNDSPLPWLSAYAMFALESASKRGIQIPPDALDRGIQYLRSALLNAKSEAPVKPVPEREQGDDRDTDNDNDAENSATDSISPSEVASRAYAERAFIADVLAALGKPDPGILNKLYDDRAEHPLFSQAFLLHAMASAAMSRSQIGTLTSEVVARLRVDADTAVVDEDNSEFASMLDSPGRTTALVLRALLAVDPKQSLAPRLAKGLLMARRSGGWRSTQENVWALLALDEYRKAQESARPDFDVSVFLANTRIGDEAFHDRSLHDAHVTLLPAQLKQLQGPLALSLTGTGKIFYSAELKYEVADLPQKPIDRGLFVQKTMRAVKLSELDRAGRWIPKNTSLEAHAGDLVIVDLVVETAEPREQIVIDDPLPAGLEPVDFDLSTTGKTHVVDDNVPSLSHGKILDGEPAPDNALKDIGVPFVETSYHRELKDDRVLTFVPDMRPGLYHFRYLARATVVGSFIVPPTSAECMYSPEFYGRTRSVTFDVRP